ncbi:MAG: metallophosphoesterase family protein [Rhodothermia bacterium]|nr:MAG: metallophosphoesterase family protein [Rhodothermia bacterium]
MQIALISDIHSNLQALEAVMERVDEVSVDAIFCLGDVVGYGADPSACLAIVKERCSAVVLGNHDVAVSTGMHENYLPKDGRKASRHNRAAMSDEELEFLQSFPYFLEKNGCSLAHATPLTPERWIRLSSYQLSQDQFDSFETDVCFVGHTHKPTVISDKLGVHQVRRGHRYLINIGSVGQPRDGDPRACVAFFDTEQYKYSLHRIEYDVEKAAERVKEEGLPKRLGKRLARGV